MTKKFKPPFIGVEQVDEFGIITSNQGDISLIIKITNPVLIFSSSINKYYEFHSVFLNIIKMMGAGTSIQKQDVFTQNVYSNSIDTNDFLTIEYFKHFEGRRYVVLDTYLIFTNESVKSKFFNADIKKEQEFFTKAKKVIDFLVQKDYKVSILNRELVKNYVYRFFSISFIESSYAFNNIKAKKDLIEVGEKKVKILSLIDIDVVELPTKIKPFKHINVANREFPVDLFSAFTNVPACDVLIFNQVVSIPNQRNEIFKLEAKKRKHRSMPDPENEMAVEDIDAVTKDIAREGQLLVYTHYDVIVIGKEDLSDAINYIEGTLFEIGIVPSKQGYNQYELFIASLPGNSTALKSYDKFLTTSDAACCFFFKEALPESDNSQFLTFFTDRQGVPLGIDPSDLPVSTNRCNNRNKFVLGPSGSGKSFFMNALLRQYAIHNTDIVLVDTGHSYSGLCEYFRGKYITYTEDKPITMNPFAIKKEEYNEEKREFLKSLIFLIWKGAQGNISQVEEALLGGVIVNYYESFFNFTEYNGMSIEEKERLKPRLLLKFKQDLYNDKIPINYEDKDLTEYEEEQWQEYFIIEIEQIEKREKKIHYSRKVNTLSFNSFYEFAVPEIERIANKDNIKFDISEFKFILKRFYKGGDFQSILNDDFDTTLFDEQFIVFEIDNIKEHKLLFPIVTLIIMDVFIQKMRLKPNRKVLCIEEAWKAIASPIMAGYILYLYKTVRKFFGEAIVVTQDLEDIISNPIVKSSILSNSDCIMLLDQTKFRDNYSSVAQLLNLSDVEQNKIFTVNNLQNKENRPRFKEVYIKRGAEGEVYGVEVSQIEYFTFTTERTEKEAVNVYRNIYESFEEAVIKFVEDLNRSKLRYSDFCSIINLTKKIINFDLFNQFVCSNTSREIAVKKLLNYYRNDQI